MSITATTDRLTSGTGSIDSSGSNSSSSGGGGGDSCGWCR